GLHFPSTLGPGALSLRLIIGRRLWALAVEEPRMTTFTVRRNARYRAHHAARPSRATGWQRDDRRPPAGGGVRRCERRGSGRDAACGGDLAARRRHRALAAAKRLRR